MSARFAIIICLIILFTASTLVPVQAVERKAFVNFSFHEKVWACGVEAQLLTLANAGYATSNAYVMATVKGKARVTLNTTRTKTGSERVALSMKIASLTLLLKDISVGIGNGEVEARASIETGGSNSTAVKVVVQGERLEGLKAGFTTSAIMFDEVIAYADGDESFAWGMGNNINHFKLRGSASYKRGDKRIIFNGLRGIMTCYNNAVVETSVLTTQSTPLH